ncbi:DsbC family protein [Ramlibacter sp. PS3R-8]|uniref:DsbC family protein n=1 Tax=Ramlibacter sp. PS3R-8 TaxID=3133437 RepID=UPI0030B0FE35
MHASPVLNRRLTLIAVLSAALLAACGKETETAPAAQPAAGSTPVSVDTIAAQAKGFSVGSSMASRVVYVFFDAQCPHCAALWDASRPLRSQARFVWIPVGLINEKSFAQGATILVASDPAAAMDEHEAALRAQQGGISAMGVAGRDVVKRNTELMNSFGFGGVPTIVWKDPKTGAVQTIEGSLPAAALAKRLGFSAPG